MIDDGSPDGTAAIVKNLMAGEFNGRLHLLERSGKLGLGTAYITGFKWALQQGYDFIFVARSRTAHCKMQPVQQAMLGQIAALTAAPSAVREAGRA